MARITKEEKQEYIMYVENQYDLLMNIKEERNISYGELYYIENLKLKDLKDLDKEINDELLRITKLLEDYGYSTEN